MLFSVGRGSVLSIPHESSPLLYFLYFLYFLCHSAGHSQRWMCPCRGLRWRAGQSWKHSATKFSAIILCAAKNHPESPICWAISARSRRREVGTVLSFQNVPIGLEKCLWLCTPPNLFSLVNGWIFLCWKVWMYVLFLSLT